MNGCLIWVKGLDNLSNFLESSVGDDGRTDFTRFYSHEERLSYNEYLCRSLNELITEKSESVNSLDNGVIDIVIKGKEVRFIIESLTAEQAEDYIIHAPDGVNIVVIAKPKNISKKMIEVSISERNRLMIDYTIPKPVNILQIIKNHKNWTKGCIINTVFKAIGQILINGIYDILTKLIFQ